MQKRDDHRAIGLDVVKKSKAPTVPRLLRGPELPFAPEFEGYLFMGQRAASIDVGHAAIHGLNDVQVVQHIFETAVIREPL